MAGHRITRAAANPDGQPRPTRAAQRTANLQASQRGGYATAQDERGRFNAAAAAVLSADKALRRRDPAAADDLTREATQALLRTAMAATARLAELGPRPRRTAVRTTDPEEMS
jgi:hypothetical protein